MLILTRALLLIFLLNTVAHAATEPFYARTKVRYERTNVSETATVVYDKNGNVMGQFFNTPIDVPISDSKIAASISPDGSRIMSNVLTGGMIVQNTVRGPMVRVTVNDYRGYRADTSSYLSKFGASLLGTPTEDFYVPLSEFTANKMRVIGLAEGADTKPSPMYSRFLNAVGEPSGNYVMTNNDLDYGSAPSNSNATLPQAISIYPPTCSCARGTCVLKDLFGPRVAPVAGASTFHKGLDIAGGTGTILVSPDRVVISENGWMKGYGWRTVLRSLTYTNPQLYYAMNHQVEKPPLSVGQVLQPGDQVGIMGATGRVSGPHLHFEVYRNSSANGNQIDPLPMIRLNMQRLSKANTEIVSYKCDSLRARIRGGPDQLRGAGSAGRARR